MKNLNKKGFTLVELLSVIVILSVVILIATNAVIPAATSAKKQVLAGEANIILPFAESLYSQEGAGASKCYSYQELLEKTTLKKNDEKYTGSVKITVDDNGKPTYKIWLSNGTYMINGKSPDITPDDVEASGEDASTVCGESN